MLTTVDNLLLIPTLTNQSPAWLGRILAAADKAIKSYCKQNLELQQYTEYYSGNGQQDVILKQFPVLSGTTQIAAGSNGVALPTATINVVSTVGFPYSGTLAIQTAITTYTTVTYTGITE